MDNLEEIKKKKIEELQRKFAEQYSGELKEQVELRQQIELLENIAKQYMSKEAISRYGNLKSAHPELALQVSALIAQAIQSGQVREKITDEQFKEVLKRIQGPKKEFKILKR